MTAGIRGRRPAARPRTAGPADVDRAPNGIVAGQARPRRAYGSAGHAYDEPRPRRRLRTGEWFRLGVLALVLMALGAAAGYGTSKVLPTKYAAHADLLYALTREQPTGFLREDRNITTQIWLFESRTVLEPVAAAHDVTVKFLTEAVEASVVEGSEVIQIRFVDTNADRAQELLGAIVNQYLDESNNQARTEFRDYVDGQLTEVQTRISEVRAQAEDRQGELAALVEREQWLRTQIDELELSDIAGPGAKLLVAPYVEASPVSPKPVITTAAGGLAGVIVAVFAVAFVARRKTRI